MQSIQIEFSFWLFAERGPHKYKEIEGDIEASGSLGNCNYGVGNWCAGL